ncbi:MAG: thiamine phosphate synthase [Magnetococcus sp. WYHC-3]
MSATAPRLLLILPPERDDPALVAAVLAAAPGHLLVRDRHRPVRERWRRLERLLPAVRDAGARLLVHERADLALALGADGVHLPESAPPSLRVRDLLGSTRLLGRSCHDAAGATQALAEGADYITLSPLFPTASHPDAPALGLATFSRLCAHLSGAVLALGGIHLQTLPAACHAGAHGVAVLGAVWHAPDPPAMARNLWQELAALTT